MICLESMAHQLVIVSHRSPKPYAGPEYDLHEAARNWVSRILQPAGLFPSDAVYFLPTKQQKIQAIKTLGCSAFLDDLPEILDDEAFPESTTSILFRPSGEQSVVTHSESGAFLCTRWEDLPRIVGNLQ
jgi:hypothetical protein